MRNATELMVQYAAYHRDRRNIITHFVGLPLIVLPPTPPAVDGLAAAAEPLVAHRTGPRARNATARRLAFRALRRSFAAQVAARIRSSRFTVGLPASAASPRGGCR